MHLKPSLRVSVIIPVLDDVERLCVCLEAIARQTLPSDCFEVLVVDNGSRSDPASALQRFPFVRLMREPAPGSYAARNAAVAQARGRVLAFTDSDCVPAEQWLESGVRAVEHHGSPVVIGGRVQLFAADSSRPTLAEEFELALGFSQQRYVLERHYGVTANLFTTRQTFEQVGPFNAELCSGGDKEWGQRAHRSGVPLQYSAEALVRHPARRSLRELMHKRARVVGGHLGMARQRYPSWLAFGLVFAKACAPPVMRMTRVRPPTGARGGDERPAPQHPLLTRARRFARIGLVGVSLQAYSAFELVRLQLGKPPVR